MILLLKYALLTVVECTRTSVVLLLSYSIMYIYASELDEDYYSLQKTVDYRYSIIYVNYN